MGLDVPLLANDLVIGGNFNIIEWNEDHVDGHAGVLAPTK
jgi:hypothetical protein